MSRPLNFAGKLDVYRRMKGLTIAALAAKTKVNPDTMERLLAGRGHPSARNLKLIELALNVQFEPDDFDERGA